MIKLNILLLCIVLALVSGCQSAQQQEEMLYPLAVNQPKKDKDVKVKKGVPALTVSLEKKATPVKPPREIKTEPLLQIEPPAMIEPSDRVVQQEERMQEMRMEMELKDIEIKRLQGELAKVEEEEKVVESQNQPQPQVMTADQKKVKSRYLRIISLPIHEYYEAMAAQITSFLQREGIVNAIPKKSGDYWVVDIAIEPALNTPEAKMFQEKVQAMKFQGKQQFQDAFYVTY